MFEASMYRRECGVVDSDSELKDGFISSFKFKTKATYKNLNTEIRFVIPRIFSRYRDFRKCAAQSRKVAGTSGPQTARASSPAGPYPIGVFSFTKSPSA